MGLGAATPNLPSYPTMLNNSHAPCSTQCLSEFNSNPNANAAKCNPCFGDPYANQSISIVFIQLELKHYPTCVPVDVPRDPLRSYSAWVKRHSKDGLQ